MAEIAAAASALWASAAPTILPAAATAATAAVAAKALAPKPPKLPNQPAMPDQATVEAARRRSLVAQGQRHGRDSTILSQNDEGTLG